MALVARLSWYAEPEEQRLSNRRTLRLEVPLAGGSETNALIYNLSTQGLLLETAAPLQIGDYLAVKLPEAGAVAAEVIWVRDGFAGCQFDRPLSNAAISAALLQAQPQPRPIALQVAAPSQPLPSDDDLHAEPAWVRATVIAALILAAIVAMLFVFALFSAPFALN